MAKNTTEGSGRGPQGIPGPPGPAGPQGRPGSGGERGPIGKAGKIGHRGIQGLKGANAAGPSTAVRKRLIKSVDRHIENIYGELTTQLNRISRIQAQVDELREKIRKIM